MERKNKKKKDEKEKKRRMLNDGENWRGIHRKTLEMQLNVFKITETSKLYYFLGHQMYVLHFEKAYWSDLQ